jgi:hypothetical protein
LKISSSTQTRSKRSCQNKPNASFTSTKKLNVSLPMLPRSNTPLSFATKPGFLRDSNQSSKTSRFAKKPLTSSWTKKRNVSPVSISPRHLICSIFFQTAVHQQRS